MTAAEAVANTIEAARLADRLGYQRFWVSEHHNMASIAGSVPEVLMAKLASETGRIRIGSGGIMLPNHSALKIAESFRMLETLFPGRIDLGMGRAPGTDRLTASLLNPSNDFHEQRYLDQLKHLQLFFKDGAFTEHGKVIAAPVTSTKPMQWILSSSGGSSKIAAEFGMGLSVARFINGQAGPGVVEIYRKNFKPSEQFPEPEAFVATVMLCAETEEKARQLRLQTDFMLLQLAKGKYGELYDYDEIKDYNFSRSDLQIIKQNDDRIISGTPDQVKEQLEALAGDFGVNEIMITTMNTSPADRLKSFEILSESILQPETK